jgi:RNA polymerase sigma-70 factor (ECF subfamily)
MAFTHRYDASCAPLTGWLRFNSAETLAHHFSIQRARLRKIVNARLDPRVCRRVDPDDVLQEAYLDASDRWKRYVSQPAIPLPAWLRLVVCQTLSNVHRRHLGVKMRDAGKDVSLHATASGSSTPYWLDDRLRSQVTLPAEGLVRAELVDQVQRALDQLNAVDREVLELRCFQNLSNNQVAKILELSPKASSNRYTRAMARLKENLQQNKYFSQL